MNNKVVTNSSVIEAAFLKAKSQFKGLRKAPVSLIQKNISNSTMRAQPTLFVEEGFNIKRGYKIEISFVSKIDNKTPTSDLPFDVLVGWFAHELGHVLDYHSRSSAEMVVFGIKYLISDTFKQKVERKADILAIQNGFSEQILEAKKYILNHSDLNPLYKRRLEKYYYSIEDIEDIIVEKRARE